MDEEQINPFAPHPIGHPIIWFQRKPYPANFARDGPLQSCRFIIAGLWLQKQVQK